MTLEDARRLLDSVKDGSTWPPVSLIREALRATGDLTDHDDVSGNYQSERPCE